MLKNCLSNDINILETEPNKTGSVIDPVLFTIVQEYSKTKNPQNIKIYHKNYYDDIIQITSFLYDDCNIQQRFWHILNNNFSIQICKTCPNLVKWETCHKRYRIFCSVKCSSSDKDVVNKRVKTKKLLGFDYNNQIIEKRKATNNVKYGGNSPSSSSAVREKQQATNIIKYGVASVMQSEIVKTKKNNTIKSVYGVDNISQIEDVKLKKKNIFLEKYGSTNILNSPQNIQYVKSKEFSDLLKSEKVVEKKKRTSNEKYNCNSYAQIHILPENLELLNNCEWLLQKHHVEKLPCSYIASLLGVDRHTVANKIKSFGHDIKHYYRSAPEIEIETFLKDYVEVQTNVRNIIKGELDIFIKSKMIAIEYCGLYWHSDDRLDKNYHHDKYIQCKNKGIRLIQIFEDEWLEKKEIIKNKLLYIIGKNQQKVFARKCNIRSIDNKTKTEFFDLYHIQGDGPSSVNYGLYYQEELVAVIGYINQQSYSILNRYCTKYSVVGGFSKLLKYTKNMFKKIVTFADLRWSDGELYINNGFVCIDELKPDYSYVKNCKRFHKFGFRHKYLKNKLDNYDSSISEFENVSRNGFFRIWDAGKLKFVLE